MPQKPILLLATGDEELNVQIRQLDSYRVSNAVTYLDVLPKIAERGAPDIAIVSPFLPSKIDPAKAIEPLREKNTRIILLIGSLSPQEIERDYIPLAVYDLIPNPVTLQAIEQALRTPASLGEARQLLKKLPQLNSPNAQVIEDVVKERHSAGISLWQRRRQDTKESIRDEQVIQPAPPEWLEKAREQQQPQEAQHEKPKKPPIIILQPKDENADKPQDQRMDWRVQEKLPQQADNPPADNQEAAEREEPVAQEPEIRGPKLDGWLDESQEDQQETQQPKEAASQEQAAAAKEEEQEEEADTPKRNKSFGFTVLAGDKETFPEKQEPEPLQQPALIRFDSTTRKEERQPEEQKVIFLRGHEAKPLPQQPRILAGSTGYTIACFSPRPTGKSFIALNLAAQLARQAGPTTLVVPEGDLDIWERLQLPLQRTQAVQIHGVPSLTITMPHAARLSGQTYTVLDLPASFAVDEIQPDWLVLVIYDMDAAHRATVQQVAQMLRHRAHLNVLNQWQWSVLPKEFEIKLQMDADVIIPTYPSEPAAQLYGRPLVVSGQGGAEAGRAFTQLVDEVNRLLTAAQSQPPQG